MPELPEVETVRRGLAAVSEGALIESVTVHRPDLRFAFPKRFADRLVHRSIVHMGRRAKYLVADLDDGFSLIMHLGMSGSFRIEDGHGEARPGVFYHAKQTSKPHDHVIFNLIHNNTKVRIVYNDPRRFGFMDLVRQSDLATCKHFRAMGIEPTGNQLNGEMLARLFHGKTVSLKAALLDQKLIAGLGNIYVCESLWRAGLSPKRKATTITRKGGQATARSEALSLHIRDVISEAIEAGGSSLRDHRQTNGDLGYFQHRFSAYDRADQPCSKSDCTGTIKRIVQNGRSTFYCPTCQR